MAGSFSLGTEVMASARVDAPSSVSGFVFATELLDLSEFHEIEASERAKLATDGKQSNDREVDLVVLKELAFPSSLPPMCSNSVVPFLGHMVEAHQRMSLRWSLAVFLPSKRWFLSGPWSSVGPWFGGLDHWVRLTLWQAD